MKDSGIEWIGEIPDEWGISTLGKISSIVTGSTPPKLDDNKYYAENGLKWVKPDNLNGLIPIHETKEYINQNGYNMMIIVPPNTPLVCCIGSIGKVGYCDTFSSFNQQINAILFNENIVPRYGLYCLISQEMQHWYYANGTVIKILNSTNQKKIVIAVPPLAEQRKISSFLDKKCAEIDAVLEKTRESIEEYKKLKQAVITEAVTKGVRGKREMKDSGVEWIGEIPKEWNIVRGKQVFCETCEYSETGTEELLTVSHITGVTPRSQKNVNMFMAENLVGYKICHKGDIAANTMWMWQGAIGVSKQYGVISPSYNTYRQTNGSYVSEYLDYLLRIRPLIDVYSAYSTGITASRLRLYPNQFLSLSFILPDIDEQKEIADYLDKKTTEIDTLIAKKEVLLEELDTYKKSLIYEYVTGKKRVSETAHT